MGLYSVIFSTSLIFSTSVTVAFDTFSPAMKLQGKTLSQSIPPALQNVEQFRRDFEARYIASGSMQPTLEIIVVTSPLKMELELTPAC